MASIRTQLFMGVSALAAIALHAPDARAAAPANPGAQPSGEVVITARRTEENAQKVPITVDAFNTQKIRESSLTDLTGITFQDPGVFLNPASNNSTYFIRGQGPTGSQGHYSPGVMTYVSDVPLPINVQSTPQYDINSIQVLKGVQGTLFGRNAIGGAILIYPNKPTYGGLDGYLQVTGGSYNWREFEGAINVPIVQDKLALRVSGHDAQRDGWLQNISPSAAGHNGYQLNNWSFRVQLRWDPTTKISNNLMFDSYESITAGQGYSFLFDNGLAPVPRQNFPAPPFPSDGQLGTGSQLTEDTGSLVPSEFIRQWNITDRLDVDFGPVRFANIFGYRDDQWDLTTDLGGVGLAIPILNSWQYTHDAQLTDEVQFSGKLFDNKLDWRAGAFYLQDDPETTNAARADFFSVGQTSYPFITSKSEALFGHVSLDLSDLVKGLSFEGGFRYTWDSTSSCTAVVDLSVPSNALNAPPFNLSPSQCSRSTPGLDQNLTSSASSSSSGEGWVVGLNWQVNDSILAYVTSRRGYGAGGLNTPMFTGKLAAYQAYQPETVTDVEVGLKTNFDVGGMRGMFDIDAFESWKDNVQNTISLIAPVGANSPTNNQVVINAGNLTVQGIEFQASVQPTRDLTLNIGGSFLGASGAGGAVPALFAGAIAADPADEVAPRQSVTAGLRYQLPIIPDEDGQLVFNANYYWSSSINGLLGGQFVQGPYQLANFRLDWYDVAGGPVDLAVFVTNAFDQRYAIGAGVGANLFSSTGALGPFGAPSTNPSNPLAPREAAGAVNLGEPRMIAVQLRYHFGGR